MLKMASGCAVMPVISADLHRINIEPGSLCAAKAAIILQQQNAPKLKVAAASAHSLYHQLKGPKRKSQIS